MTPVTDKLGDNLAGSEVREEMIKHCGVAGEANAGPKMLIIRS